MFDLGGGGGVWMLVWRLYCDEWAGILIRWDLGELGDGWVDKRPVITGWNDVAVYCCLHT